MIRSIQIQNFKSIADMTLELGRVTVLIGANGSGKSNILEAIAFAAAASQRKLENEFLSSRGIRVTEPQFMQSAFELPAGNGSHIDADTDPWQSKQTISFQAVGDHDVYFSARMRSVEGVSYSKWLLRSQLSAEIMNKYFDPQMSTFDYEVVEEIRIRHAGNLPSFLIYAPENTALRTFQEEGQILPLGIKGQGLFAHLKALNAPKYRERLDAIREHLKLIEWFEDFSIPEDLVYGERTLRIRDKFLAGDLSFDQRSANEGFLYLLFYLTLLISPDTPGFFAIDNIDNAMNPKLCIALVQLITELAAKYDKQVILTTHNPAVLDGLNLHDDNQRLMVVERKKSGETRARRVEAPQPLPGDKAVSLSRAFMRGFIGGLPKNF